MKPSETLRAAKAKIENPEHWTTRTYYRDSFGDACKQQDAVCFCSYGALRVVNKQDTDASLHGAIYLEKAINENNVKDMNYKSIDTYNDSHSHSEVMAMWDRAIELAEAEEKIGSVS